jgi:O-antigen/teichoic acid export membrane protein
MAVNHKLILKNSALMYIRMMVTILISLFTVRIVLKALGVQDFGLYNVVSGIVVMLSFLSNTLATTTQRFLSYELGLSERRDNHTISIFGTSMILYLMLCALILVLAETLGLWYVNTYMTIPKDRLVAANWIYQFSIISFIFTILSAPYNACIISHEKMDIYAYLSIVDAILKLLLVYLLMILGGDKLILYGLFLLCVTIVEYIFYRIYCRKNFVECHYTIIFNKSYMKTFGKFGVWNIWGAVSNVFMGQGVNLLLNAFFNVVINAARGLAYQVDRAINTIVQNFYTAVRPQIVKNYAIGEYSEMYKLVFQSTRLGYYMMLVLSVFFIFNMESILTLWLGNYPIETILFGQLVIISNLIIIFAQPFSMVIMASGQIAHYQFVSGLINIFVLPISWIIIRVIHDYNIPFYVMIVSALLNTIWTIINARKIQHFSSRYFLTMCTKLLIVTFIICGITVYSNTLVPNNIWGLMIRLMILLIISAATVWLIDLNATEKNIASKLIYGKFKRRFHNK